MGKKIAKMEVQFVVLVLYLGLGRLCPDSRQWKTLVLWGQLTEG